MLPGYGGAQVQPQYGAQQMHLGAQQMQYQQPPGRQPPYGGRGQPGYQGR
jgi:hypothetical protein